MQMQKMFSAKAFNGGTLDRDFPLGYKPAARPHGRHFYIFPQFP
jgi:hypothetical protein